MLKKAHNSSLLQDIPILQSASALFKRDLSPGFLNRTFSTEKPNSVVRNLPLHRLSSVTTSQLYYINTDFSSVFAKIVRFIFLQTLMIFLIIFLCILYNNFLPSIFFCFFTQNPPLKNSFLIIYNIRIIFFPIIEINCRLH